MSRSSDSESQFTTDNIDEEIQRHRAAIISLQRRRNSLIPVGRLPPKVLRNIFLFHVLDGRSTFVYKFSPNPKMPGCWVNITFVCHRWREVAIDSPRLWSFLGTTTSPWLGECVSRSRTAPLHFRLCDPPISYLHRIFGNLNTRDRIEELHAEIDATSMVALFGKFNNSSTSVDPTQRPLSIGSLRLRNNFQHSPHVLEWPKNFLSRHFPKLWRLELIGCNFDWNSPIFTSSVLTRLAIHQMSMSTPPVMSQLLTILEKQYRLQKLNLGFGHNPVPSGGVSHVHLAHLRKLRLSGPLSYCFELATHLSYPRASTVVTFHVRLGLGNSHLIHLDTDFEHHILNFLSLHYGGRDTANSIGNVDLPIIRHLSLKADHLRYQVDSWPNVGSNDPAPFPSSSCHIGIEWQWSEHLWKRSHTMTMALCAVLPLTHLLKLTITGINADHGWSDAFNAMDKVEELEVSGGVSGESETATAVILALEPRVQIRRSDGRDANKDPWGGPRTARDMEPTSTGTCKCRRKPDAPFQVPLPNLRRLQIHDVDFSAFDMCLSDLPSCLEARVQVHRGLDLLVLRQCSNLSHTEVETYIERNIATVVDWDGEESINEGY